MGLDVTTISKVLDVREGTRKYGTKKETTPFSKTSSSGSSFVGRTFVRPAQTSLSRYHTNPQRNEISVLNILEDTQTLPPQNVNVIQTPEAGGFFSNPVGRPPSKRQKTFWRFDEGQENTDVTSLPSSSFSSLQNTAKRNIAPTPTNMFIEETAENECNQFRANIERMKDKVELKSQDLCTSPSSRNPILSSSVSDDNQRGDQLQGRDSYQELASAESSRGQLTRSPMSRDLDCPTPQLMERRTSPPVITSSSNSFHGLSPPLPQNQPASLSSNLHTRKSFFSDITTDSAGCSRQGGSSSKPESFFKIPELPAASSDFESMFNAPSRVTTLPRITTPQLFLPYQKGTPSKSTPQTKSSLKTPSTLQDNFYVISVTEGRGHAMCEVGIAAIDLNHPVLYLSQYSDSQTYKKTLARINVIDPAEMLVPDTFRGLTPSVLFKTVTDTFPDMRVMTVKRQYYSAKYGLETVRSLLLPDSSSIETIIHRKYYTLAAAAALMKYVEIKHGKMFAPKSLKVTYQSAKDIVSIDLDTCQRLELVMSNAEMVYPEKYSLFGLLNHTKTLGGKRRLRISLLQPSSSPDILQVRQNSVTALVNNQRSLEALQMNLLKFSNVERLLWLCLKSPNFRNEARTFETFTNYILLLKASLEAIPHLREVLQDIDDDYIINIRDELSNNRYDEILARILKMIQEDARPARGYSDGEKQRCFAIKEGVNDLLDVARATYSDLIQQVMDNISDLGREHGLPLKMTHSADLGFHPSYVLPKKSTFQKEDLPEIFTEVKLRRRTVHLLTEGIYFYNMRIKRALQEIQLITNVVIYDLVESLRGEISLLYRLCDHISDLDFLACIAQVSSTPDFTRPVFGEETSLVGARHPILDFVRPSKPIPNDVTASTKKNFNIVTGPNMGGKTVYVLMIPLIQIMAQVGLYVPADKATIRITDHIYVKKGSGDSIECKLSSFMKEIKELTYTLSNITESSLIILDEICSGTLSDEGTAVAWGFCEEFLKRSVFTFLTTHYHYLTRLSKVFKNVTNYHMEAIECSTASDSEFAGLTFTYRLLPGVTKTTNYAIRLMMSSGLPEHVKKNAVDIVKDLVKKRAASLPLVVPETPTTHGLHSKIDKIEYFMNNLYGLSMTENFTQEMITTLQRMAIEEILSDGEDELESRTYKSDSGKPSGKHDHVADCEENQKVSSVNHEKPEDKIMNLSENLRVEKDCDVEVITVPLSPRVCFPSNASSVTDDVPPSHTPVNTSLLSKSFKLSNNSNLKSLNPASISSTHQPSVPEEISMNLNSPGTTSIPINSRHIKGASVSNIDNLGRKEAFDFSRSFSEPNIYADNNSCSKVFTSDKESFPENSFCDFNTSRSEHFLVPNPPQQQNIGHRSCKSRNQSPSYFAPMSLSEPNLQGRRGSTSLQCGGPEPFDNVSFFSEPIPKSRLINTSLSPSHSHGYINSPMRQIASRPSCSQSPQTRRDNSSNLSVADSLAENLYGNISRVNYTPFVSYSCSRPLESCNVDRRSPGDTSGSERATQRQDDNVLQPNSPVSYPSSYHSGNANKYTRRDNSLSYSSDED